MAKVWLLNCRDFGCEAIAVDKDMERVEQPLRIPYLVLCRQILVIRILSIHSEPVIWTVWSLRDRLDLGASVMANCYLSKGNWCSVCCSQDKETEGMLRYLRRLEQDAVICPEKEIGIKLARNLMKASFARTLDCTVARLQYCGIRSSESMDRQEPERVGYT